MTKQITLRFADQPTEHTFTGALSVEALLALLDPAYHPGSDTIAPGQLPVPIVAEKEKPARIRPTPTAPKPDPKKPEPEPTPTPTPTPEPGPVVEPERIRPTP